MKVKYVYLLLCVVGIVLPYSQFVPWLIENGLDLPLLVDELFSTQIGAFFGLDVIVSAAVLFVFIYFDGRRLAMRRLWMPAIGTLLVGVSFGLPLFLYMREVALEDAN